MNITIVADVLGKENNGTTITAKRLIQNLEQRGHHVKICCPSANGGENYYETGKLSLWPFNNYIAKNGVELAKIDKDVLKKSIVGADVVHILLPFRLGKAAVKLCRELGIPYTSACHCQAQNITAHLNLINSNWANDLTYKAMYDYFYKYQKYVHCPSEFIAKELRNNGYDMDLRVISNGVSPEYVKKPTIKPQKIKDKFCILFIGRFSREKRHDLLIEAVKKSAHEKDIQLIFAGLGPLQSEVEKLSIGLTNYPIMGFHTPNELVDIINYCDLYVHPSDFEIEAISCLEAITCGLVPIISDNPKSATNAFALTKDNLFKAGDSLDLAKKIDYLFENEKERAELSAKYVEYAERFQISRCIDQMEKMFNDAIANFAEEKDA